MFAYFSKDAILAKRLFVHNHPKHYFLGFFDSLFLSPT